MKGNNVRQWTTQQLIFFSAEHGADSVEIDQIHQATTEPRFDQEEHPSEYSKLSSPLSYLSEL